MTEVHKVVTLLAEKGKKWDETQQCISSCDGSIVFLPRGVTAGEVVRVELTPVSEKLDTRGKVMYSAKFAPVILSGNARRLIANEARLLRSCQVYDQTTALALLVAKYGTALDTWKSHSHYFFEESGWIFASHLSPASLYIYEQFGAMQGALLTEPLLWVLDKGYYALREQGKELDWRSVIPQLTDEAVAELVKKVEAGEPVLSTALVQVVQEKVEIPGLVDQLWRRASWPALAIPNLEGGEELPAIVSREYGRDLDGEILKGYGVLGVSSSGSASWQWYKDFTSATIAHEQSDTELEKLRKIWVSKAHIKSQLDALSTRLSVAGLSSISFESTTLRWGWEVLEYSAESFQKIITKLEEKEKEVVQTALEEAMRKAAQEKAEVERARAEAVEPILQAQEVQGEIIRNLRVWIHTSGSRGDAGAAVICPDGSLREHDRFESSRSHGRGDQYHCWDLVSADEGLVQWTGIPRLGDTRATPIADNGKVPVGGWTPAQIEAIRRLEEELGILWLTSTNTSHRSFGEVAAKETKTPEGQKTLADKLAELKKFGVGGKA